MLHKIKIHTKCHGGDWGVPGTGGYCRVYVDDVLVGSGPVGGGADEDNTRGRDYNWIEFAFVDLAKALGVDVEHVVEDEEN